jgi:hypothetical protein
MKTIIIQFATEKKDIAKIANQQGWVIAKAVPIKTSGRVNFELTKKTDFPEEDLKIIAEALPGVIMNYKTIL